MDHIAMQPNQPQPIHWRELAIVFTMLFVVFIAFGIAGQSDYTLALAQERDDLRLQLDLAQDQLRMAGAIVCSEPGARFTSMAQVQP